MLRRLTCVLATAGCAAVAGCYQRVEDGSSTVHSVQPWAAALLAAAGVAAVPLGVWVFARKSRLWGVVLAVAGALAAGVVAPTMYLDRVEVTPDGFTSRHGFWWSPIVHEVRYDDLAAIRRGAEQRRRSTSYFLDCTFKSGRQERVPLGDVMREAEPDIVAGFRAHGVPFLDLSR